LEQVLHELDSLFAFHFGLRGQLANWRSANWPEKRRAASASALHLRRSLGPYHARYSASGPSERVLILGAEARFFLGHDALLQQLGQALVERLHAVLLTGLDRGVHLRDLAFTDQVTDRGRADHD